ncbi:Ribosomal RNA processing protein [Actinidia chinensis var. chinensis]|uniref:rRNA biogenesis protein RRP36 n=1 Tax=Actinidia chinensis var. chinensis TaxID=1590841 RepID=A0A2R6PIQ1_ACTCC|nr:Ribosomal RNA processing protein [Actinidia chinensis var. chinensis]
MKKSEKAIATSSKIKFEESEERESSSENEGEIERELADVTFEELQKARSNGSHAVYRKPNSEKKGGRANKNRPMEASAKKPVGRFREVIQVPKKVVRDPRFESLCGNFDVEGFKKRYSFIYENELPAEREELKRLMKKSNDPAVIEESKNRISLIDKQLKSASKHSDRDILAKHKRKEREAAKQGKKPFYLKKSEIQKQRLVEKYEELKASGKLESFLEKRRRKNAAKDHRYMPYRRPEANEHQNH